MPSPRSDTRQRIQDVARELFTAKGVQRTSLQDIAARLGITKPALYYHFSSRDDLVRSIVVPLIDGGDDLVRDCEAHPGLEPREILERYFDYLYGCRADFMLVISELSTLADLGLIDSMLAWRERLTRLIYGADPTLEEAVRGVIALGGIQDCCLQFPDAPAEALRDAAVTGGLATLSLSG